VNSWLIVWTVLLIGAAAMFAVLAIVVMIGGFADVRALFRNVDAQHQSAREAERDDGQPGS